MYNLLMIKDENQIFWEDNNDYEEDRFEDRLFAYTKNTIKKKYENNLDELKNLPCLFTYEKQEDCDEIKACIGYIKSIKKKDTFKGLKVKIKFSLSSEYPSIKININNHSDLSALGIDPKSWELTRTHFAVKNKNLFQFLSKYFAKKIQKEPTIAPKEMKRIWGEDCYIKSKKLVFLSHKAKYKNQVSKIKDTLKEKDINCFVAHQDISPTLEWKEEIIKALDTMHIFVGIVTDDFHTESWTDQEIGYAYKRKVPRIFIKIGKSDPKGFVQSEQAETTKWTDVSEKIIEILKQKTNFLIKS